jgi:hypothetical protein
MHSWWWGSCTSKGHGDLFTLNSAALGLGSSGCGCCALLVFDRNLQSKVPLVRTPLLLRLKRCHACDPMTFLSGVDFSYQFTL